MTTQILLCIDTFRHFGRGVVLGANEYARRHTDWLFDPHFQPQRLLSRLRSKVDYAGIICQRPDTQAGRLIARRKLPAVSVEAPPVRHVATVVPDDAAIGRMAADYFLRRGYTHLGFSGVEGVPVSDRRQDALRKAAEEAGATFHIIRPVGEPDVYRSLPFPIGVLAALVWNGTQLVRHCRLADVMIPEQLAVLSVDDDEVITEVSRPPLSAIDHNPHEVGYRAAELLDRIIKGEASRDTVIHVPPLGVVERQSSAALAVADEDVAAALRFISDHALEGIHAGDVLAVIPVARRTLEVKFRKLLGRTIQDEINRVRMDRAKVLLTRTNISIAGVSQQCGFSCQSDLSKTFARLMGLSPLKFRQQHRHGQDTRYTPPVIAPEGMTSDQIRTAR